MNNMKYGYVLINYDNDLKRSIVTSNDDISVVRNSLLSSNPGYDLFCIVDLESTEGNSLDKQTNDSAFNFENIHKELFGLNMRYGSLYYKYYQDGGLGAAAIGCIYDKPTIFTIHEGDYSAITYDNSERFKYDSIISFMWYETYECKKLDLDRFTANIRFILKGLKLE